MTSHSEISLRHFPDQSDSSLSFQIPQAANVADLLLADADDFLNDNDFSFTTPAPLKTSVDEPLTLSQLTPAPRGTPNGVGLSNPSNRSPHTIRTSPLKTPHITHHKILGTREIRKNMSQAIDSPISKERLANLKAEVDSLDFAKCKTAVTGPSPAKPVITPAESTTTSAGAAENGIIEQLKRPIRNKKTKATVVDGGVTKNKSTPSSSLSRGVPSASRRTDPNRATISNMIRPNHDHDQKTEKMSTSPVGKTNNSDSGIATGAVERLLKYDNKLMTQGLHGSGNIEDHEKARTANPASGELVDIASPSKTLSARHEDPFTLSQISPRKQQENEAVLISPATTQDGAPPALEPLKTKKVNTPGLTHRSARTKHLTASSSKIRSIPKRNCKPSSHIRQARSGRVDVSERSRANVPSSSRGGREPAVTAAQTDATVGWPRSSSSSVPHSTHTETNKTEVPPLPTRLKTVNTTKPVEFNFRSDARLQARKDGSSSKLLTVESGQRATASYRDGIPDFRALHERHLKASVAFRKEHIVPTVPVTPDLNTKYRAKEREKFDEFMRGREEAMGRVREEKRRQQEAEDEKEIREIRKRAIPKAHDVPDWYASAPKRGNNSKS